MKPVYVVVLLSCINVSYTCPSACSCDQNIVYCNNKNLNEFPSGIPATTQTLYFNGNQITNISSQNFEGLSALVTLKLNTNRIAHISPLTFEGLPALKSFMNQITNISPQVFEGLSALETLVLSGNQITNISSQVFEGISALVSLSLENNQITNISPQTFEGLPALKSLKLNENQITTISSHAFEGPSALETLDLINNPLDCSSCDLEALKVFLNDQTQLGNAGAVCDGTKTYVVNHDFKNCIDSSSITTDNLILIVVGSVGALAVVIVLSVCVAYACYAKKRKRVVPSTNKMES